MLWSVLRNSRCQYCLPSNLLSNALSRWHYGRTIGLIQVVNLQQNGPKCPLCKKQKLLLPLTSTKHFITSSIFPTIWDNKEILSFVMKPIWLWILSLFLLGRYLKKIILTFPWTFVSNSVRLGIILSNSRAKSLVHIIMLITYW